MDVIMTDRYPYCLYYFFARDRVGNYKAWNGLTNEQKVEACQTIEDNIAQEQKRPTCTVTLLPLDNPGHTGRQKLDNIYINSNLLREDFVIEHQEFFKDSDFLQKDSYNINPELFLFSILHEALHFFQFLTATGVISNENLIRYLKQMENSGDNTQTKKNHEENSKEHDYWLNKAEEIRREWQENIKNYISPEKNPREYYKQPIEQDANKFAEKTINQLIDKALALQKLGFFANETRIAAEKKETLRLPAPNWVKQISEERKAYLPHMTNPYDFIFNNAYDDANWIYVLGCSIEKKLFQEKKISNSHYTKTKNMLTQNNEKTMDALKNLTNRPKTDPRSAESFLEESYNILSAQFEQTLALLGTKEKKLPLAELLQEIQEMDTSPPPSTNTTARSPLIKQITNKTTKTPETPTSFEKPPKSITEGICR